MKLIALQNLIVPEGAFSKGETFETSPEIAARVVANGYAREASDAAVHADPEPTHREEPIKRRRGK
jgi:hypothetical protein